MLYKTSHKTVTPGYKLSWHDLSHFTFVDFKYNIGMVSKIEDNEDANENEEIDNAEDREDKRGWSSAVYRDLNFPFGCSRAPASRPQ